MVQFHRHAGLGLLIAFAVLWTGCATRRIADSDAAPTSNPTWTSPPAPTAISPNGPPLVARGGLTRDDGENQNLNRSLDFTNISSAGLRPGDEGWTFFGSVATSLNQSGDIEGTGQSSRTWEASALVGASRPLPTFGSFSMSAIYQLRDYTFDGRDPLLATSGDPFKKFQTFGLSATYFQPLSREWAVFLSGGVSTSGEVGADLGEGVRFTFIGVVGHEFSSTFRSGLGVIVVTLLEDDPFIFPTPQFDWRFKDDWRLALEGRGLVLSHTFGRYFEISAAGTVDTRRFRLRDNGPMPDGTFDDTRIPITFRFSFTPSADATLEAHAGVDIYREYRVSDADGRTSTTLRVDPGVFAGLSLTFRR